MCRRVGAPVCGRPNCPSNKRPYPPGLHGRGRKRLTEYQMRLVEKQKLRAVYGVGERQFRRYFQRAEQKTGVTGEELLRQLETRVDAIMLRLGFALTMRQARQLVSHGHIAVNGRRVTISSYLVTEGDTIELRKKAKDLALVLDATKSSERDVPDYIDADHGKMSAKFLRTPKLADVPYAVQMQPSLVVEFYSR